MGNYDIVTLQIRPILPRFGAEVAGLDLTQPLSAEARKAVLDTQGQWGVTVWRNTGLTDETHIAFSRTFGQLELAPAPNGRRSAPPCPCSCVMKPLRSMARLCLPICARPMRICPRA